MSMLPVGVSLLGRPPWDCVVVVVVLGQVFSFGRRSFSLWSTVLGQVVFLLWHWRGSLGPDMSHFQNTSVVSVLPKVSEFVSQLSETFSLLHTSSSLLVVSSLDGLKFLFKF